MPSLVPQSERKQLYLPSTEHLTDDQKAWVVMEVGPLTAADLLSYDGAQTSGYNTVSSLVPRIKEWNIEEDGVRVPITFETVKRLLLEDIMFLDSQIGRGDGGLPDGEKKDSPTTSSQPETEKKTAE